MKIGVGEPKAGAAMSVSASVRHSEAPSPALTDLEQEMVEAWEAFFRLRGTPAINEQAAVRKRETEYRHLRELERLSLLAARNA